MRTTCARLRKSEEAVAPVIATILMVAITVVLAAVLYAFLGTIEPPKLPKYISANVDSDQNNWTVKVNGVKNGDLATLDVLVLVTKADGSPGLNSTLVSDMVPGAYYHGVRFLEGSIPGNLNAGDRFTLDRSIYGSGTEITFVSSDGKDTLGTFTA